MKRNICLKIAAFALVIMTLLPLSAVYSYAEDAEYTENEIETSLVFGSGDLTLATELLQRCQVKVTNNTDKEISGTLQLFFPLSYYSDSDAGQIFEATIDLNPGITKTFEFTMDANKMSFYGGTDCYVIIRNDSGKLLKKDAYNVTESQAYFSVGWMSDTPSDMSVLTRGSSNYNYYTEALTGDFFPSDYEYIKRFSFIIINDVDLSASSQFTKAQLELLEKYLNEGGTVIIGTGDDTRALSAFSDYFSGSVEAGFTQTTETIYVPKAVYDEFETEYYKYTGESLGNSVITEMKDENFTPVVPSASVYSEFSNLVLYKHKSCNLYIANFDLSFYALKKRSDSATIVCELIEDSGISVYSSVAAYSNDYFYFASEDLDSFDDNEISFVLLLLVLILYIGVGIVVPFIISRVKKKARYAVAGITASAILFSVLVFTVAFFEKGGSAYAHTAAVTVLEKDGQATSYISARTVSPTGGKKTLSLGDDCVYAPYFYPYDSSVTVTCGKDSSITGDSVLNWGADYVQGFKRTSYSGTFTVSALADDTKGTVTLTVKNDTGKDVKYAVVYAYGNILVIGDFPAGTEKTFADLSYSFNSIDYITLAGDLFYYKYGFDDSAIKSDISYDYYYYYYSSVAYSFGCSSLRQISASDAMIASSLLPLIQTMSGNGTESVQVYGIEEGYEGTLSVNGSRVSNNTAVNILYAEADIMVPGSFGDIPESNAEIYNSNNCYVYGQNIGENYVHIYQMDYSDSWILYSYDMPVNINLVKDIKVTVSSEDGTGAEGLTVSYLLLGRGIDFISKAEGNYITDSSGTVITDASLISRDYLYGTGIETQAVITDDDCYTKYYDSNPSAAGTLLILLKNKSGKSVNVSSLTVGLDLYDSAGNTENTGTAEDITVTIID